MNIQERHKAYTRYLTLLAEGNNSEELAKSLSDAFNVSEDDINNDVNDIIKLSEVSSVLEQSVQMRILMEDLRDYRDISELKKTRDDILIDAYSNTDDIDNEIYIFPI